MAVTLLPATVVLQAFQATFQPQNPIYAPLAIRIKLLAQCPPTGIDINAPELKALTLYESDAYSVQEVSQLQWIQLPEPLVGSHCQWAATDSMVLPACDHSDICFRTTRMFHFSSATRRPTVPSARTGLLLSSPVLLLHSALTLPACMLAVSTSAACVPLLPGITGLRYYTCLSRVIAIGDLLPTVAPRLQLGVCPPHRQTNLFVSPHRQSSQFR